MLVNLPERELSHTTLGRHSLESMGPIRVSKSFPARYWSGERWVRALNRSKSALHSMTDPRAPEE
jgi:hypothetical protein